MRLLKTKSWSIGSGIRNTTLSFRSFALVALAAFSGLSSVNDLNGQDFEKEPINYAQSEPDNVISRLQTKLDAGEVKLEFEDQNGYVKAVLEALNVPLSSQSLVFSKTSLQREKISPTAPRAIYFADDIYVGFCQKGDVVEISAVDPKLGAVFYTLDQQPTDKPKFVRHGDNCLICHASSNTQNVPGHVVRSVYSDVRGLPILSSGTYRIDHTSPFEKRWGGWYVSGTHGNQKHLGNLIVRGRTEPEKIDNSAGQNVTDFGNRFRVSNYPTPHSDIVALMVLEHQGEAHNLITRANFLTRQALHFEEMLNREMSDGDKKRWDSTNSRIKNACDPLVKYILFAEEAELKEQVKGTSSFAEDFPKVGPRDSKGRSLRDFDLQRRLFKYPCSYLVYSESFDQLPAEAYNYVLERMWQVLKGEDTSGEYAKLSKEDRLAIAEILSETKPGLPEYWKPSEIVK